MTTQDQFIEGIKLEDLTSKFLTHILEVDKEVHRDQLKRIDKILHEGDTYHYHFEKNGVRKVVTVWCRPWLGSFIVITKSDGERV
jgi:hypothetical protein